MRGAGHAAPTGLHARTSRRAAPSVISGQVRRAEQSIKFRVELCLQSRVVRLKGIEARVDADELCGMLVKTGSLLVEADIHTAREQYERCFANSIIGRQNIAGAHRCAEPSSPGVGCCLNCVRAACRRDGGIFVAPPLITT